MVNILGIKMSNCLWSYLVFVLILIPFGDNLAAERYVSIERSRYLRIEYELIMSETVPLFVLNQPYTEIQIDALSSSKFRSPNLIPIYAKRVNSTECISILAKPTWEVYSESDDLRHGPSILLDGYFKLGQAIGVNRALASSNAYVLDSDFHGDTSKWVGGYMYDAYIRYSPHSGISLFHGRTARNFGIPNEFSLFLSNNPYPYDHFGFSFSGESIQFSWYTGRLNDLLGYDEEGYVIPIGDKVNVQRYIAMQRLDWILSRYAQIGISEATLYGGPGQSFEGAYLNPLNFYYLSQRNQGSQMNGSWQISAFIYSPKKWAFYLDFYIDDFIINNEPGVVAREIHPDRLGVMGKFAIVNPGLQNSLLTLRYVRVWNETYVTWRNFENWVYYNKGLGYPFRAHEAFKLEMSLFGMSGLETTISSEFMRQGEKSLHTIVNDGPDKLFPAPPVTESIEMKLLVGYPFRGGEIGFKLNHLYARESAGKWRNSVKYFIEVTYNINLLFNPNDKTE